jgi:hypothetical protein
MPNLYLYFPPDTAYVTNLDPGVTIYSQDGDEIKELGILTAVDVGNFTDPGINSAIEYCRLTIDWDGTSEPPPNVSYIFMGRNNKYEYGGLKGYYAEVTFRNNASDFAELYAVSSDIAESSK